MTDKEKIEALAKALGYIKPDYQPFKEDAWFSPSGLSTLFSQLPKWLTDLNAMNAAWKTLSAKQQYHMAEALYKIVDEESSNGEISMSDVADNIEVLNLVGNASARQRADAMLSVVSPATKSI